MRDDEEDKTVDEVWPVVGMVILAFIFAAYLANWI